MYRIKEARKLAGINQTELANEIGVTKQLISLYESGKREPKIDKWQKIASVLNVSVPYLQGITDKKSYAEYWDERLTKSQNDTIQEFFSDASGEQRLALISFIEFVRSQPEHVTAINTILEYLSNPPAPNDYKNIQNLNDTWQQLTSDNGINLTGSAPES